MLLKRFAHIFTAPAMTKTTLSTATGPTEIAYFTQGCFWGTEHIFRKHYAEKGLVDTEVGYIGGQSEHPSYRQVCSGSTGYAEGVKLTFDPAKYDLAAHLFGFTNLKYVR